jgi:2-succinyl-6-hydroxy-2,4-cyclohexadiene-1-carboxylate synthase
VSRGRPSPGTWAESATADVRGVSYRVRVAGRKGMPLVLLLHGFAGSSRDWETVAASLAGEGYAVLAVDLPGHGETDAPQEPWRYGPEETSRDLTEILARAGATSAHWVGYSMGGRLALYVALAHPERVLSLVLESVSPGIEDPREREARRASDESLAHAIEVRGVPWFAEHWAARPVFTSQQRLAPAVRDGLQSARLSNRATGLAGSLRGFGQGVQPWLGDHLESISCPTLIVTGGEDDKYDAMGIRMSLLIPDAVQQTTPGAGHNVHLERPEAFTRAVLAHLAHSARHASGPASWTH